MSSYQKHVLETLKNGPKTRKEIVEEICPKKMSKKKLQVTLNDLEDEARIIRIPKRIENTHRLAIFYALPKHKHLLEVDLGEVVDAVKYLRLELCRNPDVEDVAAKIGRDPEDVRKVLFTYAPKLKWKPPTPEEKEDAERQRKKAWETAAQIKYSKEEDIDASKVSIEDIRRSEFVLEHHFDSIKPEQIPFSGVVLFPGSPTPSPPKERTKQEAEEAIKKVQKLIAANSLG